jgi:hypothetical protein
MLPARAATSCDLAYQTSFDEAELDMNVGV